MIDWTRVDELRDEVGTEDFDEVVTLFLSEVEERLGTLDPAGELRALEEDLHFLKGSALNLGFEELAHFCGEGEALAASGKRMEGIARTADIYARSKSAFLNALGGIQAA